MSTDVSQDYIGEVVRKSKIAPLTIPVPPRVDNADHIIKMILDGHTKLAADHVMHPDMKDRLMDVTGSLTRRLGLLFDTYSGEEYLETSIIAKYRIYDALLEIVCNLLGAERDWAGFSEGEAEEAVEAFSSLLKNFEERERGEAGSPTILRHAIMFQLKRAKLVNKGNSMVAWMAVEIEKGLRDDDLAGSYVKAVRNILRSNFYYVAYRHGFCKFGNDYALGLRWLRHLGYVQVSTNPVLASVAYDDDPSLWEAFKEYARKKIAKEHPEWLREPEKHLDEMAMEATIFVLLENFYVFRLPFILSKYQNGLVSYQLNPLIADDAGKSVSAAKEFARRLENILMVYDEYLLWGYDGIVEKGRPNLVIKVAASYPSAIEITRRINEMGIGQNITLSYTISQIVLTGMAAMEGMVNALKKGILPTQTYLTNMGGRLEDHLLESVAENLLLKALEGKSMEEKRKILGKLMEGVKVDAKSLSEIGDKAFEEQVRLLTTKKALGGSLLNNAYVEALTSSNKYGGEKEVIGMLQSLSDAIKLSGSYVAKRAYEILFSENNRRKWVNYLVKKFGVPKEDAELIVSRIDLLPASKRKHIDTLLTLSSGNVTNTEFPNHQLSVAKSALENGFRMEEYRESIAQGLSEDVLNILMDIEDFAKAYEATPELESVLNEVGIKGNYGGRGVRPEDWPRYGPCEKTLKEFTAAYLAFRDRVRKALEECRA
ncbi:MAG: transaldolase family protein [Thermoproteota archaeon]